MNKTMKELRLSAELTTKQATEKLDISLSLLYKIEQGYKKPGRDLIARFSNIYNCSVEDIFLALSITNRDKFAM